MEQDQQEKALKREDKKESVKEQNLAQEVRVKVEEAVVEDKELEEELTKSKLYIIN